MHARQSIPEGLARLAQFQAGVVSREQALGAALSSSAVDRLVRDGFWGRTARGIYLTAPIPPPWPALAWSGVLIGGDRARLGGLAAAHLHGLVNTPPSRIEVLVPHSVAIPRVLGPWDFHRERPGARQLRSVGSPPRLTIEDRARREAPAELRLAGNHPHLRFAPVLPPGPSTPANRTRTGTLLLSDHRDHAAAGPG